MSSEELHPVEARLIEDLRRRDWIIEKESHKEYGRILAAAKKKEVSAIRWNAFLNRLNQATRVKQGDSGWVALDTLFVPVQQDIDMFEWIVGMDDAPIGIDDNGDLYVSTDRALEILRSERDRIKGHLSDAYVIMAFLGVLLVVTMVTRCVH